MKNLEEKYKNLAIGIISILSYYIALKLHNGSLGSPHTTLYGIFNLGFLRGFGGIGFGYFLEKLFKDNYLTIQNKINSIKEKLCYTVFELFFLYIVVMELFIWNSPHKYNFAIVFEILILITLFLLKRGFLSNLADCDIFAKLARYTYSIYITHYMIFGFMKKFIIRNSYDWYLIPILLLVVFGSGVLVYHLVEVPCANLLKRKWLAK